MSDWKTTEEIPATPVQVEVFFANGFSRDRDGNEVSAVISPYRDERRQMAYWDGEAFRWMRTGHRIVEFSDHPKEWIPTHWRALPPLPNTDRAP